MGFLRGAAFLQCLPCIGLSIRFRQLAPGVQPSAVAAVATSRLASDSTLQAPLPVQRKAGLISAPRMSAARLL